MNDHTMTEDQAESHRQWLTLWKWLWAASVGTIIYAVFTPTFNADWVWLFAVFIVTFMLGTLCKGFADDVAANRNDTLFALAVIALLNMKGIFITILAIVVCFFVYVV